MQAALQAAHEMEAGMGYMEPPRLYQPVKHCLGYVLMQAGNPQKAAEVPQPFTLSTWDLPRISLMLLQIGPGESEHDTCTCFHLHFFLRTAQGVLVSG